MVFLTVFLSSAGAPFKKFASLREEWALNNRYISPGLLQVSFFFNKPSVVFQILIPLRKCYRLAGPIQFTGPGSDALSHTLLLELGAE